MSKNHTHYRDYLDLRGDGRIVLYKRTDHQNPKWTVRLKIPHTEGFIVKSAKTTDDYEARRFAEELYYQLEGKARRGEPIRTPTFGQVFQEWAKAQNIDLKIRSKRYVNGNVRRVELWLLGYFRDTPIDLVNESRLGDYAEWRQSQMKKPAVHTLKNERTALNQMFRFAKRKGYIRELPPFEIKSMKANARPDLPDAEWHQLIASFDGHLARSRGKRIRRARFYLRQYVLLLAQSGIRVGEARRLKWRDLSETKTLTGDMRVVLTVRGKTGEREVVCNRGVENVFEELKVFRCTEIGAELDANEHIFCHASGKQIISFRKGFDRALEEAGVLFSSDGRRRVPYSLRHTYATMRISEGVSVFQLAANMGTSVEMIDSFYGKKRVRDPKMATELTKQS